MRSLAELLDNHDRALQGLGENAFTVSSFGVLPSGGIVPYLHTEDIAKKLWRPDETVDGQRLGQIDARHCQCLRPDGEYGVGQ